MAWSKEKKLSVAIGLSFLFCCVEVLGGYFAHSLAIMSDAAHLLTDIMGFAISLAAIVVSKWGASEAYSFGFKRAEILGALASILVIWILTGWLLFEAFERLYEYHMGTMEPIDGKLMSGVALFGICTNICIALVFSDEHGEGFSFHSHDHGHDHGHSHDHGSKCDDRIVAAPTKIELGAAGGCKPGHDHDHSHGHSSHGHGHSEKVEKKEKAGAHDHSHDHGHDSSHCGEQEAEGMYHAPINSGSFNKYGSVPASDDSHDGHSHGEVTDAHRVHTERDVNMEAAYMHVLTDLITGIGVLISGLLIWYDQRFLIVDPICTLIFAVLVLQSTAQIVGRVMTVLFEGVPEGVDYFSVKKELEKIPGVVSVHHLHIWAVSSNINCLSCHMSVRPIFSATGSPTFFKDGKVNAAASRRVYSGSTVANYHTQTLVLARAVCKKQGVDNVTIQIEDADDDCPTHDCDLDCAGPQEKV